MTPDLWPSNTARFPGGRAPSAGKQQAPRWTENPTALPPAPALRGSRTPRDGRPGLRSCSCAFGPHGQARWPHPRLQERPCTSLRPGQHSQGGDPQARAHSPSAPDPRGDRQVSTHSWRSMPPQGGPHHGHRAVSSTWAGSPLRVHAHPLPQAESGGGGTAAGKAGPAPPSVPSPGAGGRGGRHQPQLTGKGTDLGRGPAPPPDMGQGPPPLSLVQPPSRLRCEWKQVRPQSPACVQSRPVSRCQPRARVLPTASDSAATQHGLHN